MVGRSMSLRGNPRPGGRSARVQDSVHRAVRALLARHDRADLTFPMIAAEAGVTPSTLYRRWGELPELLADVALARMRPETDPAETGSLRGDLEAWAVQYLEEIASTPGRSTIRDVLGAASTGLPCQCLAIIQEQLEVIASRARDRGEAPPDAEAMIDRLVAPLVYRVLFSATPPAEAEARQRVAELLQTSSS